MTKRDDLIPLSLTPVQRRRLEASLAIDDQPADRVHGISCYFSSRILLF